jgi:hypothetical protein
MRSKQEYVLSQDDRGKQTPRKVGMAPQQRDGFEYEFDVFIDMDNDNTGIVQKTRCPELTGKVFKRPGADVAGILLTWLSGEKRQPEQPKPAQQAQDVATFRNTSRPWPADMAIDAIRSQASIDDGKPVDEGLWGALVGTLDSAPFNTQMRHELVDQIFQVQTTKDLNPAQRKAMLKWSKIAKSGPEKSDPWVMDGNALTEYKAIVGSLWVEQPASETTDEDEAWAAIDAAGVASEAAPF